METDARAQVVIQELQDVTRQLLKQRYGDFGEDTDDGTRDKKGNPGSMTTERYRFRVKLELEFQPSHPDFNLVPK